MNKQISVLITFSLFLLFSCKTKHFKLGEKSTGTKSEITENHTENVKQNKKFLKIPKNKISHKLTGFEYKNKKYKFHDLAAAPLFDISVSEQKILKSLIEFFYLFDQNNFKSLEEAEAVKFFSKILHDSSQIKPEHKYVNILNKLKHYILPVYVYKKIDISYKPDFSFDDLANLAYYLYSKGFNLNSTNKKELEEFLTELDEICWKSQRGKLLINKDAKRFLDKINNYVSKEDRKNMEKFVKKLSTSLKLDSEYYTISKFILHVFSNFDDYPALRLIYPSGQEYKTSFENLTLNILPKDPFFIKLKPDNSTVYDSYLLLAAGSCSLCISKDKIPGHISFPRNLRQTDWNQYGKYLSEKLGKKLQNNVKNCMSGSLDFVSVFNKFLNNSKGFNNSSLTTHILDKKLTDGEILKRIWINLITVYSALQRNLSDDFLRKECKLGPLWFISFRYIYETSLNLQNEYRVADEYFIKAMWILNQENMNPDNASNDKTSDKISKNSDKINKNKEDQKKIKDVLSSVYFASDPKYSFIYSEIKTLDILTKMATIINSNPQIFINKLKHIKQYPIISKTKREIFETQYNKYVPDIRIYLPTHIYIKNNRLYYRRASDSLNYYLKSYFFK